MRGQVALLFVLASAALAAAAPPTGPAKVTVAVGELARVEVVPSEGKPVGWRAGTGEKNLFVDELAPRPGKVRLLVQGKVPGVYLLVLWSAGETDSSVVEVEVTGTAPAPPGPGPGPTPDPVDPARKGVSYRVVFVEETSAAAGGRGAMFTDRTLDARMREKGHGFRIVDKDVVGVDGKPPKDVADLLPLAAAKSYPQVFLVDKAGKLKTLQFDAPTTAAALVKIITDNGG